MPKIVEKTRAGNRWSEARYFSFIRSCLRKAWNKYPVKYDILNENKRQYEGTDKRIKWEYQCSICKQWYLKKNIEVDHINSCGSLKSYEDLHKFVETLFCEKDNLRVVCKNCHKKITNNNKTKEK